MRCILSVLMGLLVCLAFCQTEAQGALEAYWPMDKIVEGEVLDLSGNGLHGTVYGGATIVEGMVGGGLDLDGSTGYVLLPQEFMSGPGSTLALWARADTIHWQGSSIAGCVLGDSYRYIRFYQSGRRFIIENDQCVCSAGGISLDENTWRTWHHIAVVYGDDGSGGSDVKLYIDGGLDLVLAFTHGVRFDRLGFDGRGAQYYWNGTFDEVRIYDEALSADGVKALYDADVRAHVYGDLALAPLKADTEEILTDTGGILVDIGDIATAINDGTRDLIPNDLVDDHDAILDAIGALKTVDTNIDNQQIMEKLDKIIELLLTPQGRRTSGSKSWNKID